ncbi:MAG: transglutaminase-like domain-containing protein [Planctomycetota bacterium]
MANGRTWLIWGLLLAALCVTGCERRAPDEAPAASEAEESPAAEEAEEPQTTGKETEPPAESGEPRPPTTAEQMESQLGTSRFGVYFQGEQKCGYAKIVFERGEFAGRPAFTTSMVLSARIRMGALVQPMEIRQDRYYALTGELLGFDMNTATIMGKGEFSGRVEGEQLVVQTTMGGHTQTHTYPVPDESLTSVLAAFRLLQEGKPGDTIKYEVFDVMARGPVTVSTKLIRFETRMINGVKTRVGVFHTSYAGMGLTITEYVTEGGQVLKTAVGQMFTLRREPEDVAKDVKHSFNILRAGIIQVDRQIGDPRRVVSLKLGLTGVPKGIELLEDGRQSVERGGDGPDAKHIVTLKVASKPDAAPSLPMDVGDPEIAKWLKSSSFAQSDNADIRKLAAKTVGDTTDAFAAAGRIQRWVYANVEKKALAAISNAVAVMKERKGDCSEHSILFVALCRAAGIPARQAIGIGYSQLMGGFGYHAWAEVWVGKWVAMDPTWGEDLADATHVKFGIGDTKSMGTVAGLFGSLQIEVLELEKE